MSNENLETVAALLLEILMHASSYSKVEDDFTKWFKTNCDHLGFLGSWRLASLSLPSILHIIHKSAYNADASAFAFDMRCRPDVYRNRASISAY
jgi:hypothetical protein